MAPQRVCQEEAAAVAVAGLACLLLALPCTASPRLDGCRQERNSLPLNTGLMTRAASRTAKHHYAFKHDSDNWLLFAFVFCLLGCLQSHAAQWSSPTLQPTHSPMHPFVCPFMHSFIHSSIHAIMHPSRPSAHPTHSPTPPHHLPIHPSTHSLIYLPTHHHVESAQ